MCDKIDVTLQIRAKHADMHAAAVAFGGQSKLAEHLGVSQGIVGDWCNLRNYPHVTYLKDQAWLDEIEAKLFVITQKTLDELFPPVMRSRDFLDVKKTVEVTQRVAINMLPGVIDRLTLSDPSSIVEKKESAERLLEIIRDKLPGRMGKIIKLRWGLDGEITHTAEEVGHIFKVTRERIRQIEARAFRVLQSSDKILSLDPGGRRLKSGESARDID